jgi:hypothetical protein
LAVVLTLIAVSIPAVRRRWPRPAHRILLAIGIFAALVVLTSFAMSRPATGLLALGAVVSAGVLLRWWVLVVPRRLVPPVPDKVLRDLGDDRARLEVSDAHTKLQNDIRTSALQAVAGLVS